MEWIDSKYRLPEKEGVYLVHAPSMDHLSPLIVTAYWGCRGWTFIPKQWAEAVTHWMPLPAPPNR